MNKSGLRLSWTKMKEQIALRDLYIQWIDEKETYHIWTSIGPWHLITLISKDGSDDCVDFETNYKDLPTNNRPPALRTQQTLGEDQFTIKFQGVPVVNAPANQTTEYDYLFDDDYAIQGGMFCASGGQVEDEFTLQIVDKDNVLGYGAGLVLSTYVSDARVVPNVPLVVEDVSVGFLPVPGLYARIIYKNNGANAAKVLLNLKLFSVL